MKFTTDDYFHIGHRHLLQGKPCQDYAFSAVYGSVGFAVVSDGCSGGRYTDIGSRLIALSTAAAVKQYASLPNDIFANVNILRDGIRVQQEHFTKLTRETLSLELDDMLATCGYICLSPVSGFVELRGDGSIAILGRDKSLKMICCSWDRNTPLYPAYASDGYKDFIKFHGGDPSIPALKINSCEFKNGAIVAESEKIVSISEGIKGLCVEFSLEQMKDIFCVAVFSDGVSQIGNISGGGTDFLDWKNVVSELMGFKSLAGEFAKRRIISFLKEQSKKGKVPVDDIALAVVQIEEEGD